MTGGTLDSGAGGCQSCVVALSRSRTGSGKTTAQVAGYFFFSEADAGGGAGFRSAAAFSKPVTSTGSTP